MGGHAIICRNEFISYLVPEIFHITKSSSCKSAEEISIVLTRKNEAARHKIGRFVFVAGVGLEPTAFGL